MTTFLLIRHAAHMWGGNVIAGRSPNVHLSELGRRQAADLAERLSGIALAAIYCSPLDRTRQTASVVGDRLGLEPRVLESLNEIDFGTWTGRRIDEMHTEPAWHHWNAYRSGTRIPGGELMSEAQLRILGEMERLRRKHAGLCIALVSHGDVIKAAVAHALGVHLDLFQRIEISLASVSVVVIGDHGPWVLCVNNTGRIEVPESPET